MTTLRTALIGCGHWGEKLARNLHSLPAFDLVAVCDVDPHRARSLALRYEAHPETEPERLLRNLPLDAVVIASPAQTHARLAAEALSGGLHVLVEKPLAMSSQEAEQLVKLSFSSGRVLMTDHTEVHSGVFQAVLAQVECGALGVIRRATLVHHNEASGPDDLDILWDLAPHDYALLDALFGKEEEAPEAVRIEDGDSAECAESVRLALRYREGVDVRIDLARGARRRVRTLVLEGTEGTLLGGPFGPEGTLLLQRTVSDDGGGPIETEVPCDRTEPLEAVCRAFADRVRAGDVGACPSEARIPAAVQEAWRTLRGGRRAGDYRIRGDRTAGDGRSASSSSEPSSSIRSEPSP